MTLERTIARVFRLDDAAWMRHANPWSVILRNTVLPILIIAFWSRLWLGWWAAVPVALALLWTWLNPHLFPAPRSLDHWTSESVLGERVWLNRDAVPVPVFHHRVPNILSAVVMGGGIIVLLICTVIISGCDEQKNQTLINTGTPTSDLVTDMQYRPIDLPLRNNTEIPAGLVISNLSVGILNDGNLLFQGMISNTQKEAVPGYIIVYIELLGNDSATVATSPPLVSPRNLPAGGKFPYFYVTLEPLKVKITAYRIIVQIYDMYPGV